MKYHIPGQTPSPDEEEIPKEDRRGIVRMDDEDQGWDDLEPDDERFERDAFWEE